MSRFVLKGLAAAVAVCVALISNDGYAYAEKAKPQHSDNAVPPGFESLAAAQTTMADVFYGDRPIGMMQVTYTPDTVTLSSPAEIVRRIPDIKNPDEVEAALTGEISSNVSALCISARDTRCGVITPEVAGVTYNAGQFRLDVFIAEEHLQTRSAQQDKFLPESTSSFSMVHGLRATASGTQGTRGSVNDSNSYTLFGNSLVGWRENHLVSDWDYSDENGVSVETLYAQRDANGMQYGAGFLDSNASLSPEFSSGRRILGARMGTSDNSRTDQAGMSATPLQIFTSGRSRVEIFRDDRLIYATRVEAGSQELDTSSFPVGAYEVTIKVYDGTTLAQELTRFFVKSRRIPPSDEFHWQLEAGEMLSRSADNAMPQGTEEYLIRGALAFQVAEGTGLSTIVSSTSGERTLETELYHQGTGWDLAATGMLGNNNAKGLALETTYSLGSIYGNYYYRRLWNDRYDPLNSRHVLLGESYETHNLSASTILYGSVLTYTFSHNKDLSREENTSHSLSWFKNIWNYQNYSLGLRLNYSQSDSNKIGMVELTLRNRGKNWNYNVRGQSRWEDSDTQEDIRHGLAADARWYESNLGHGSAEFGVNYDQTGDDQILGGDVIYDNARFGAELSADYINSDVDSHIGYYGHFNTSIAFNTDSVSVGGKDTADSALIVDISGSADSSFDVLVNNSMVGVAMGDSTTVVPLTPYANYQVAILPRGDSLHDYDSVSKDVTLYPGNVETLYFNAERQQVLLGKLVDPEGNALANYSLRAGDKAGRTDGFGLFQVRVPETTETLEAEGGNVSCTIKIPEDYPQRAGIAIVGSLECDAG